MATIHAIEYRLLSREDRHPTPASPHPLPCRLLEVFTEAHGVRRILFASTCFVCSGFLLLDQYFEFCEWQLIFGLRSRFPAVPGGSAEQLAHSFRQIVECAHATHRCPHLGHRVTFATTVVAIRVGSAERAAIEVSTQEAARLRPVAKDSVRELFKARDDDDRESRGECVICLEEMETRESALTLPCSHSFHEACLVQWLDANHVCPLCRYELPAAKNLSRPDRILHFS